MNACVFMCVCVYRCECIHVLVRACVSNWPRGAMGISLGRWLTKTKGGAGERERASERGSEGGVER